MNIFRRTKYEFDRAVGREGPDEASMKRLEAFLDATANGPAVFDQDLYRTVLAAAWLHGWKIRNSRKEVNS